MSKTITIIIPARYGSKRFPGKLLSEINGISVIKRVWKIAEKVKNRFPVEVIITTDDERIYNHCKEFCQDVVMSPETCRNGTERVAYVLSKRHFDIAINFQADAVLTPHWILESLIEKMITNEQTKIATPAVKLSENLYNKLNEQKKAGIIGGTTVTFSKSFKALYFSKSIIPFIRNYSSDLLVYKHIGIYAYRKDTLLELANLPPSTLEECEGLEQLRALENDIPIDIVLVDTKGRSLWAIDNPEDIKIVEEIIKKEGEIT